MALLQLARQEVAEKQLPYDLHSSKSAAFRAEEKGSGGKRVWNPDGKPDVRTQDRVCNLFGYVKAIDYTIFDNEESNRYPNGKANFNRPALHKLIHYPEAGTKLEERRDNFVFRPASPRYKDRWLTSVTCSGLIGEPDQPECTPGEVDEVACEVAQGNVFGPCAERFSRRTCKIDSTWGEFGECFQKYQAVNEICTDNIDNDCDGKTDLEDMDAGDCAANCNPGHSMYITCQTDLPGACSVGEDTVTCSDNYIYVPSGNGCQVILDQDDEAEICGDNIDNDCNGLVDENCADSHTPGPGNDSCTSDLEVKSLLSLKPLRDTAQEARSMALATVKNKKTNKAKRARRFLSRTADRLISRHYRKGTTAIADLPDTINRCNNIGCLPIDMEWTKRLVLSGAVGIKRVVTQVRRHTKRVQRKTPSTLTELFTRSKVEMAELDVLLAEIPSVNFDCRE